MDITRFKARKEIMASLQSCGFRKMFCHVLAFSDILVEMRSLLTASGTGDNLAQQDCYGFGVYLQLCNQLGSGCAFINISGFTCFHFRGITTQINCLL